jgi:hypothetical protein
MEIVPSLDVPMPMDKASSIERCKPLFAFILLVLRLMLLLLVVLLLLDLLLALLTCVIRRLMT